MVRRQLVITYNDCTNNTNIYVCKYKYSITGYLHKVKIFMNGRKIYAGLFLKFECRF